jgi:hypothetical protein
VLLVAFVLTFLGASIFNIAAGEPFNAAQVLWIHFVVNAPFGFALGFDQETPGLMARRPRPRGRSILTRPVLVTVALAGLAITIGLLAIIKLGESRFGSVQVGTSIAFTAIALCLIVAAFECRSATDSAAAGPSQRPLHESPPPSAAGLGRPPEAVVRRPALKERMLTLTVPRTRRRPVRRRLLSRLPGRPAGSGTMRRLAAE